MSEMLSSGFAALWLVPLGLAGMVGLLGWWAGVKRWAAIIGPLLPEVDGAAVASQLDTYELAYVAGGPRRAVDTALAAVVTAGLVWVPRLNRLARVRDADPSTSPAPLEQAVLDAVGCVPQGRQVRTIRREAAVRLSAHAALRERLIERGLWVPEPLLRGLIADGSCCSPSQPPHTSCQASP